ncbi:MAG: EAL domain-containing protein [Marinobacter sp.]|nr:EAL domain-containing protein [Marinobacter sp.]
MAAHNNDKEHFEIFPWNRNFETGIEIIDEQHQVLVGILNKLAWQFATQPLEGVPLADILIELKDYAHHHFATEEQVWQRCFGKQVLVDNHRESHASFLSRLEHFEQQDAQSPELLSELFEFLTRWLAFHILESDRRLALIAQALPSQGNDLAQATQVADDQLSGSVSVLVNTTLEIYGRLSSSAVHLIRERAVRQKLEQELHALQHERLEAALEAQASDYQQQLEFLAYHDPLTGTLNRNGLMRELKRAMTACQRAAQSLALVSLDLDNFGQINAQVGQEGADRFLGVLARRWTDALGNAGVLAHTSGDEFVVLVRNREMMDTLLDALYLVADQPFQVDGVEVTTSFSAGISVYPQDQEIDADTLIRQADFALYRAKQEHKGFPFYFDNGEEQRLKVRRERLEDIQRALQEGEFVLFFQPKIDLGSGAVDGLEALIRWQHPERGLLPPGEFLPVIDDHPLSIELGEWVIDEALRTMTAWDAQGLQLAVSVNIGALQIQSPAFPDRLKAILARYPGVAANRLDLEILETVALNQVEVAIESIGRCRTLGVTFSLDDFGKGYSSLSYLKRLPVQTLKIDRTFIRDMLDDPNDLSILDGIVGLSDAFELNVIAEGVEEFAQGELLVELGCARAQGFAIARPMPADQVLAWCRAWRMPESWRSASPLRRDDLPALIALVELRAWVKNLETVASGELNHLPQRATGSSRFKRWLESPAADQLFDRPMDRQRLSLQYQGLLEHVEQLATADVGHVESELPSLKRKLDILAAMVRVAIRRHQSRRQAAE